MLKKIYFLVFFILISYISQGQLYVGKACIEDPSVLSTSSGTNSCSEPTYFFEASPYTDATWTWQFPGIGGEDSRSPQFKFTNAGLQKVTVEVKNKNTGAIYHTYEKNVQVGKYPKQPLFDKKVSSKKNICGDSKVKLDPYEGVLNGRPSNVKYKWFPNGETTPTIEIDEPGCYSVEVIDELTGCSRTAKVEVEICYKEKPNQSGNEIWYFGKESGLEFSFKEDLKPSKQDSTLNEGNLNQTVEVDREDLEISSSPSGNNKMDANEAATLVLNKGKKIVLYSDGKKIYNGEDHSEVLLENGSPFSISQNVGTQGLALVPKPACASCDYSQYLLFTADQNSKILSYSIIDTRYPDKKARVIEKDIPVGVNMATKITAERNADDLSYTVYAFDSANNKFHNILVDSLGVTNFFYPNQYSNTFPPSAITSTNAVSNGYVSISINQDKLAHSVNYDGENFIEIFNLDPETNALLNPILVNINEALPSKVYGVSFSPNGNILYISIQGTENKVLQFDLSLNTSTLISNSKIVIASSVSDKFGAISVGPKYENSNRLVYVSIENKNYVPYLQAPNVMGKNEVSFTYNQASKGTNVGGMTKLGFPNVVAPKSSNESSGLSATYVGNCFNAPTTLTAQKICDPFDNEFEWKVDGKTYKGESVSHTFSKVGWHEIFLTIKVYKPRIDINTGNPVGNFIVGIIDDLTHEHCTTIEYKGRIYIKPSPSVNFAEPEYLCFKEPFNLKPFYPNPKGGDSFTIKWMTSLGTQVEGTENNPDHFLFKYIDGGYNLKLEITNNFECTTVAPLVIREGCEPVIKFPTAFTPNGDGDNEKFKPMTWYIQKPILEIYNRWGEMVFETDDLENLWDGKVKGKIEANQLYPYVLKYYSEFFPERGQMKYTGTVTLLR